ncbi:MAG: undecaprenyldiphospho-muramoylpentapeptide beta-N-acetylglucosaminyltransferase [Spirochaetes bacterium]|jgi:UDP-N-acetylglucosamine--N-acetylmuramyl-(pentapeptide) pyrophosphoryl-undecaprenol N-acetylglucosamine transferase|nr:undecaprenyldiphospho-muramoylpentapeptide beta-N-acetylglucosaminyltransferase [Spirochaetota bacterium]
MHKPVVFTGGGTAGHVFPGLAVAEALRERGDYEIVWIGSTSGMERRLVADRGIRFFGIPAGKLRRYFSFKNLIDLAKVGAGFVAAVFRLLAVKPSFVFSKGGYVSVPVVAAARLLGIPAATHESDSDPGLATRLNARLVERVLISYDSTAGHLPAGLRHRCINVGNPVRRDLRSGSPEAARRAFDLPADRPLVFVVGGSLGSAQINRLLAEVLDDLLGYCAVVHQRGEHPAPRPDGRGYASAGFIGREYADLLAAADLVVCRAGAGTLWELSLAQKPSVLIPLPRAGSRGDQLRNARIFADRGAAVVLADAEATPDRLRDEIHRLLDDPDARRRMGAAVAGFDAAGAADRIAGMIDDVVEGRGWTS